MNTKLTNLLILVISFLLGGCIETLAKRPDGYAPDRMGIPRPYIIPLGETIDQQIAWLKEEYSQKCEAGAVLTNTIVGVAVSATLSAVLAGRGAHATGAVLGGIGGGGLTKMSIERYCSMLRTTSGLIQDEIRARQPVEQYRCEQVYEPRTKQWVIPEGACRRIIQQIQVLPRRPDYVP